MQVDGDDVIVDHVYIERQMTPLNLYVRSATPEQAELAVIDYGQCIRDLAYTNIFAGDLLLKNFGVTRHNRVIFYDYDELCRVTDCRFRDVPAGDLRRGRNARRELVLRRARTTCFPETFLKFLGFEGRLHEVFLEQARRDPRGRLVARAAGTTRRPATWSRSLPYHPHRVRVASSI